MSKVKNKGQKRGRISKDEIQYIADHIGTSSIEEIAVHLNRSIGAIAKQDVVVKHKSAQTQQEEPVQPRKNIDTFVRQSYGGRDGIVQMTAASSEAGARDEGNHHGFKHLHDTSVVKVGVTTMETEKAKKDN